jgi:hypothetical protein
MRGQPPPLHECGRGSGARPCCRGPGAAVRHSWPVAVRWPPVPNDGARRRPNAARSCARRPVQGQAYRAAGALAEVATAGRPPLLVAGPGRTEPGCESHAPPARPRNRSAPARPGPGVYTGAPRGANEVIRARRDRWGQHGASGGGAMQRANAAPRLAGGGAAAAIRRLLRSWRGSVTLPVWLSRGLARMVRDSEHQADD